MMLVYSLPSTEAIYQRFGGIDGSAYFIGGFGMTALTAMRSRPRTATRAGHHSTLGEQPMSLNRIVVVSVTSLLLGLSAASA
jgi:hypothetical protein